MKSSIRCGDGSLKIGCPQKKYLRIILTKHLFIISIIPLMGFISLIQLVPAWADTRVWSMNLKCDEEVDLTFQNGKVYNQTLKANSEGNELQLKSENFYGVNGTLRGSLKIKLNPKLNVFKFSERGLWINYTLSGRKLTGWGKLDDEVDCSLSGSVITTKINQPVARPSFKKSLSTKELCLFTTVDGKYWKNEGDASAYLSEARRRGLELDDCTRVEAAYSSKNTKTDSESIRKLQWQIQHVKRFWELNKKNILDR